MYEAIIFDMDGVIVDTEVVYFDLLHRFFELEGCKVENEDLFPVVGASGERFYSLVARLLDNGLTVEEVKQKVNQYFEEQHDQVDYQKIFRQDIIHILEYAKEHNLALGLASSSAMQTIQNVIATCDIAPYFDVVVSGEMFEESKPNPEIYFHTANVLEVSPEKCLVVEDSFYGIQAAKKAGMTVVGYEETRFPIDQSHADHLEPNMMAIYERLKGLHQQEKA